MGCRRHEFQRFDRSVCVFPKALGRIPLIREVKHCSPFPADAINGLSRMTVQFGQLLRKQIIQVIDVENLQTLASKTHIGQRAAKQMLSHPMNYETLVRFAHLPWTRDHATTIDERADTVHSSVFFYQKFCRKFRRSIERTIPVKRKSL